MCLEQQTLEGRWKSENPQLPQLQRATVPSAAVQKDQSKNQGGSWEEEMRRKTRKVGWKRKLQLVKRTEDSLNTKQRDLQKVEDETEAKKGKKK